jgi:hypothetical protein
MRTTRLTARDRVVLLAGLLAATAAVGVASGNRWVQTVTIAVVVGSLAMGIGLTLDTARSIRKRSMDLDRTMRQLWSLQPLVASQGRLAPLLESGATPAGSGTISTESAQALAQLMVNERPETVVELGPGATTLIMAAAARGTGISYREVAVEHDELWAGRFESLVSNHDIGCVELVRAPLTDWSFDDRPVSWYDRTALDRLPSVIDLLVVDGPGNTSGQGNRGPAMDFLGSRLSDGAVVFVDDYHRRSEQRMVTKWLEDHPGLAIESHGVRHCILRMRTKA